MSHCTFHFLTNRLLDNIQGECIVRQLFPLYIINIGLYMRKNVNKDAVITNTYEEKNACLTALFIFFNEKIVR